MRAEDLKPGSSEMRVDVRQLLGEATGATRIYGAAEMVSWPREDFIQGNVTFVHAGNQFIADVDVVCSRCLKTFCCPIEIEIEEEFPSISVDASSWCSYR
jgi:hypothetical protein